jgi:hypothetical protein
VGDAEFLRVELQPGHFNDGKPHDYAMGLFIGAFAGVPEVYHSGSTAGYRAFLTRFPKQHLSVAVLCNASNGTAERYAHAVAAMYLGDAMRAEAIPGGAKPADDRAAAPAIAAWAGLYRSLLTGVPLTFTSKGAQLTIENEGAPPTVLSLLAGSKFAVASSGRSYEFGAAGRLTVASLNGTPEEAYERVAPWKATAAEAKAFAGRYTSDEAETELKVVAAGSDLKVTRRPDTTLTLRPVYKDAFTAEDLGLVRFRRDQTGRVIGLSVTLDRVWDMRFDRK